MTSTPSTATAAELSAAAEAIGGYRRRVSELVRPYLGTERDDLVSAIYEAERSLQAAERTIQRALKLASS
jgi:hypothetical protein